MCDVLKRLRSQATIFYEYRSDDGQLLRDAARKIEELQESHDTLARSQKLYGTGPEQLKKSIDANHVKACEIVRIEEEIKRLNGELENAATLCMDKQAIISNTISYLAYHTNGEEPLALPAEEAMLKLYERLTK